MLRLPLDPIGWEWITWLALVSWTGILASFAAWGVPHFLAAHQLTAPNYRKQPIPLGSGLAVWATLIAHQAFLSLLAGEWQGKDLYGNLTIAATAVFMAGWLDDTVGDVKVKGLRGHWHALRYERRLTTGALKALVTASAAAWIGILAAGAIMPFDASLPDALIVFLNGVARWGVVFLLLCLSANTVNLLDLRPGRALKGFFVLGGAALLGSAWHGTFSTAVVFLLPALLSAVALFRQDIRACSMLGDAGANLLGFLAGFTLAICAPWPMQVLIAGLLTGLHVAAERFSLSKVIERIQLLRWFDRLGRADRQP